MSSCPNKETWIAFLANELGQKKQSALDTHLESCSECCQLLDTIDTELYATPEILMDCDINSLPAPEEASVNVESPIDPFPEITGYTLRRQLGSGGMGDVFEAVQVETGAVVAVKVLRKRGAHRFLREVRLQAPLSHPNIARVLGTGQVPDGRPFLVIEYVPGMTLSKYIVEHSPTFEQRLELFATICEAVQFAHNHEIIHRDLKPSNILIDSTTPVPRPVIVDFGLAKTIGPPNSGNASTRFIAGTLRYMSPEQADERKSVRISTTADIYALGLILYELITGIPCRQFRKSSDIEKLAAVRRGFQRLPSDAVREATASTIREHLRALGISQQALCRKLSGDFDYIVFHTTEQDADDRYQTARELQQDVTRFLKIQPLPSKEWTYSYSWRLWARREPIVAVGCFLVLASTIAAISMTALGYSKLKEKNIAIAQAQSQAEHSASLAIEQRIETEKQLRISQAMLGFAAGQQVLDSDGNPKPLLSSMLAYLESEDHSDAKPWELALAYGDLGDGFRDQDNLDESKRMYSLALEIAKAEHEADTIDVYAQRRVAIFIAKIARLSELNGDSDVAIEGFRQSVATIMHLTNTDDSSLIHADIGYFLSLIAVIHYENENLEEAIATQMSAVEHFEQTNSDGKSQHGFYNSFLRLGDMLEADQRFDEAIAQYDRLIVAIPEDTADAIIRNDLCLAYYRTGRSQQALGNDAAAVTQYEQVLSIVGDRDSRKGDRDVKRSAANRLEQLNQQGSGS